MLEEEYICWHQGQNEGDGKELKAPSVEAAAKKAVDIWRHEAIKEIGNAKVTVFVRDHEDHTHEVVVSSNGDRSAPEAYA